MVTLGAGATALVAWLVASWSVLQASSRACRSMARRALVDDLSCGEVDQSQAGP